MEKTVKNSVELKRFAGEFMERLRARPDAATVVGLSGELGSGKTAFVKAAAAVLGVTDVVLSPTFVLAKFYDIPRHTLWSRLVHVDAYRIEDTSELAALRWEGIVGDARNLVLLEWPEHVSNALPKGTPVLTFRFVDETTRAILP